MRVNPAKSIKIKRKPSYPSDAPFLDTVLFEIEDTSTTVTTTGTTSTTFTTTKKRSFISGELLIHPPSPVSIRSQSLSSVSLNKRRSLSIRKNNRSSSTNSSNYSGRFAEIAGGATADCAAVCCCCPCGLAHLLYLTVYKVPAGLCRRALRRKRGKQLIKKGLLPAKGKRCPCGCEQTDIRVHPTASMKFEKEESEEDGDEGEEEEEEEEEGDDAMMKLEKEMWETFYNTGFWRSSSQREKPFLNCD